MEDGSADVYAYDQYGNVLRYVSFDAEGNVTGETRYENEYDDDGNLLVSRQYIDGVLQNEDTYILNDSGEYVLEKTLMYHDGGCTLNQYDQNPLHVTITITFFIFQKKTSKLINTFLHFEILAFLGHSLHNPMTPLLKGIHC